MGAQYGGDYDYDASLNYATLFNYKDTPPQDLNSINLFPYKYYDTNDINSTNVGPRYRGHESGGITFLQGGSNNINSTNVGSRCRGPKSEGITFLQGVSNNINSTNVGPRYRGPENEGITFLQIGSNNIKSTNVGPRYKGPENESIALLKGGSNNINSTNVGLRYRGPENEGIVFLQDTNNINSTNVGSRYRGPKSEGITFLQDGSNNINSTNVGLRCRGLENKGITFLQGGCNNISNSMSLSQENELLDDSDSDDVLKYISQMLMEEDMEEKPCMFHDALALQAAEKPFYDVLGKKYPPSPYRDRGLDHCIDSPESHSCVTNSYVGGGGGDNCSSSSTPCVDHMSVLVASDSRVFGVSQRGLSPLSGFSGGFGVDVLSDRESMIQFHKGVEEASKFLPKNNNLVIDLDNITFPDETEKTGEVEVKKEKDEHSPYSLRGGKIHYREDDKDFEEGRSSKQSAFSLEEEELSEMFDKVLLCYSKKQDGGCNLENGIPSKNGQSEGTEAGNNRGRKTGNNKNMVDLRTLLILCAQSTASDDRRTADELLKQIREHSSRQGDGSQRLAHYFANALEARLAGTGSQIYTALKSKRSTAADMLKAYQFFLRVCPLKKICVSFANQMILKAAEKSSKLHIIDFGILYGFQWPALIQHLSEMPGGPPKLCITGIDLPQPGFKPAERVEATGSRLAKYCERFNVPFEYHAIAQKWETIKVEDLKIGSDEMVVVNCLFRFKNLLDETIMVDSPRSVVLNLIRSIKPDMFIHGVVNGSYNAPFFVTRFREAIFHYSTMFDMFDTNATRDDPERLMFEKEFYGREIMNVVACEGSERIERPETYKQWQARNVRAGFRQLPLDQEILKTLRCKLGHFHKDFSVDVDGHWTLVGWKGRITDSITAWIPT